MKRYLTIKASMVDGVSLQIARRLTEGEKQKYRPEYREYMMVSLGNSINLNNISLHDIQSLLGRTNPDGEFAGCSNRVYIIDQDQWDKLIEMDAADADRKAKAQTAEKIKHLMALKSKAESQMHDGKLPTKEEAARKAKAYNDLHNEGGYGYVPHYYTQDEYDAICKALKEDI